MKVVTLYAGEGKYCVEAIVAITERGSSLTMCTKEWSHIGATALAQPRPSLLDIGRTSASVSSISVVSHEDDIPARRMAKAIAAATGVPCVVTCGMHVDNARAWDIELLLVNADDICDQAIACIKDARDANGLWNLKGQS